MPRALLAILAALAAMALIDGVLCAHLGLSFTHWSRILWVSAAIAAVGVFYRWSGRGPRIAAMAFWVVLWVAFSLDGAILTYAAAAQAGPLRDATFAAIDRSLGFDWPAWYGFVNRHLALKLVFAFVYISLMPQILLSVFVFTYRGWDERNAELLLTVIVALVVTTALFATFPALGPCTAAPWFHDLYLGDLIGLRDGSATAFDVTKIKGIVAFPSFHAVLAVLFVYAHRGGHGFAPIAALNTVMLATIPSEGGHYLFDVIAGLAVAGTAILAVRAARPRHRALARAYPA
ncbi:MAG TPA: phosphatase PAP2 family protein [Stellaceae bacterium]|nr:phosphatase PAP2 family protein [Stellaceae bacterium]